METEQTLIGQDDKKWERPWTTDEIRKNSANWTLAGDVGVNGNALHLFSRSFPIDLERFPIIPDSFLQDLSYYCVFTTITYQMLQSYATTLYNLLTEISQNIISRTHEVENAVDSLVYRTKMANAKICNIINDFHMLSNLQFVENRVYDEEIQETAPEPRPVEKTKEQKEAEMLPKIKKAIELGLEVLDKAFTKIHVDEISDSEDEDISSDGRTILEPKDPYSNRPLPFIIGSDEFNNSDYAGLQDLLEEDVEYSVDVESSISESDETTTDEEEPLPLDEEDKFTGMPNQRRPQPQSESDKYSSSEESDLFGSEKAENGFISDSSFDNRAKTNKITEELNEKAKVERKESKSFQPTNLPQVLPVPKMQEKKKVSDDLFATDEPSDDESPFRKKTGLFTSGLKFDDDEKDMFSDDLFGEKPKETKKVPESPKPSPATKSNTATVQKEKEEPALFGNEEDSDDDIFNTLMKTKAPSTVKENKTSKQSPSDKADSSSTPSSAPSTKPSGNAFDFMGGGGNSDSLFGDESDADDLFSTKKSSAKKFDFIASQDEDDDDLFGLGGGKASKKIEAAESKKLEEKKSSLFEESVEVDKSYKKMGTPLPGLVPSKPNETKTEEISKPQSSYKKMGHALPGLVPKKADSLFENKDNPAQKPSPAISVKKVKDSIFDDSDSSGQEEKPQVTPVKQPIPKKKEISLFDDEPDDDDIFSRVPKKLMSPGESPSLVNKSGKSQFSKLHNEDKAVKSEKKDNAPSLFEDEEDIFNQDIKNKPTAVSKAKDLSLFEDSDNFDLFSPKTEFKKQTEPALVKDSLKDDLFKSSDETNSLAVSKSESKPVKNIFADVPSHESLATSKPEVKTVPLSSGAGPSEGSFLGFDAPADSTKTLHVISKDRAKVNTKRRRPTKRGRMAALGQSEKEITPEASSPPSTSASSAPDDDLFSEVQKPPTTATQSPSTYKTQEKKKMNLMSQLMSEAAASNFGKKSAPVVEEEDDDIDIFAETLNKGRTKSRGFSFNSPIETVPQPTAESEDKKEEEKSSAVDLLNSDDADNDDFFAEPSFRNFRNSISHKNSILDDDDDDEDDLFSTVKTSPLQKAKQESTEPDIFADESDIFADITKEKYEMFPSNVYDDDGDDIFSIADPLSSDKTASSISKPTSTAVTKKEAEKKPVDLFDDPLSGLLGDD